MGTWNHRVVQTEDVDGTPLFAIHEVHYKGEVPYTRTVDPTAPLSESLQGLREELERMIKALDSPVLTDKDISYE